MGPKVTDMGPMISQWNVPKYWTYLSESGEKFFVTPHALKRSEKLDVTLFKNNSDYMNIVEKIYMDNVHGAINEVTSQGKVIMGNNYITSEFEIIFSAPRSVGELPAVKHYMPYNFQMAPWKIQ